jgi:hypothetical protein
MRFGEPRGEGLLAARSSIRPRGLVETTTQQGHQLGELLASRSEVTQRALVLVTAHTNVSSADDAQACGTC